MLRRDDTDFTVDGLAARTVSPSPYVHRAWGVDDGLSVAMVSSVVETRDGFVRAATLGGLARFDGVRFAVFTSGDSGL